MSEYDLNLSTRPFPAYRLTNMLLAGLLIVLVVVTAWQGYGFARYSRLAGEIRNAEGDARVESEALGRRLAELQGQLNRPESAAKLTEIDFLNNLIVRKSFSWTQVFADIEGLIPDSVHLISLRPDIANNGKIAMHMDLRGKSIEDVSEFIDALEQSAEFEGHVVSVEQKQNAAVATDVDVSLTIDYFPAKDNQ